MVHANSNYHTGKPLNSSKAFAISRVVVAVIGSEFVYVPVPQYSVCNVFLLQSVQGIQATNSNTLPTRRDHIRAYRISFSMSIQI